MTEVEALKSEIAAFLQDLTNHAKKYGGISAMNLADAVSQFYTKMNMQAGSDTKDKKKKK